jgi:hypothetical protein
MNHFIFHEAAKLLEGKLRYFLHARMKQIRQTFFKHLKWMTMTVKTDIISPESLTANETLFSVVIVQFFTKTEATEMGVLLMC